MATRKPKESDVHLPFVSLRLLAPPMRLVSAALWKVLKQRDVMQYGMVEEFVSLACDTVPGLLTVRHQGKLTLGLRGRLILEILRTQPDVKVLEPHMKRIRAPAVPPTVSAASVRNDVKIARTVESFHLFVDAMLSDPAEREQFFKEEFPVDYGPKFDEELEKLLWEFLIRLDQLLPIPNLAQTVSWLSDAPAVLEECAHSATQPQLLNILLQYQASIGHLEPAASLPPNMGDSILQSLSLPPSGRAPSNQATASNTSGRTKTQYPKRVIGLIWNKGLPFVNPKSKDSAKFYLIEDEKEEEEVEEEEEESVVRRCKARKRKQLDEESDEDVSSTFRMWRESSGSRVKTRKSQQICSDSENEQMSKEALASHMAMLGIGNLQAPKDPALCSLFVSCIMNQPEVTLRKSVTRASRGGGASSHKNEQGKMSPVISLTGRRAKRSPHTRAAGWEDKENPPASPSQSSSPQLQRITASTTSGGSDDYVADSEDEGTKNFKGRLFMKRYCKTKHGTYVPTLREYCKPKAPRLSLLPVGKGR